ncbi:hypothetical protein [Mixta hanseatica]|uniref:Uncharacterized protein n=1 Tax=Mixta hanseatica TaxID=2872648 RepID=A0ABY4RCP2_9GAMM|nr:hypothetical protein [Mixta hanseatica]UQY45620.1 hypothetical protein K6958_08175 [Mixta hanseatica]
MEKLFFAAISALTISLCYRSCYDIVSQEYYCSIFLRAQKAKQENGFSAQPAEIVRGLNNFKKNLILSVCSLNNELVQD